MDTLKTPGVEISRTTGLYIGYNKKIRLCIGWILDTYRNSRTGGLYIVGVVSTQSLPLFAMKKNMRTLLLHVFYSLLRGPSMH